jgi:predicted AlkP superfamily phosphohydrolase/phosphomutase
VASKVGIQNLAARVSKNTRNQIVGKFLSFDSVDWSRTVAYSMGHVGQIYLNMAGREPAGIVTEADYGAKRQEVAAALRELQDEDGRPLVTDIIPREATYHGPYTQFGPDLHLVLDDYNTIAYPLFATEGKVITQQIRGDSGCHRSEGIFIAHGPGIQQGVTLPESNILDLAPTILLSLTAVSCRRYLSRKRPLLTATTKTIIPSPTNPWPRKIPLKSKNGCEV